MNPELEGKLAEKYPGLFRDRERPPTESLMCYGCECADGWHDIIYEMCSLISRYLNEKGRVDGPQDYRFTQIKEKFGGLRVYGQGGDDYIDGVVDMAESMSYRTCELCGDSARVKSSGNWLKTLCERHAGEMGYGEKERCSAS